MSEIISKGKKSIISNKGVVSLNQGDDNFLFFDGSLYRMIIGFDENNDPVVKISEAGVSVLDATDQQLIFNSNQNNLKVVDHGQVTVTAVIGSSVSNFVAHNLGFAPVVIASVQPPNLAGTPSWEMCPFFFFASATNFYHTRMFMDDDYAHFQVEIGSGVGGGLAGDWLFNYYILQESAS